MHDEALSSRVAALNMLDLGLEHLDVDVTSVINAGGAKAGEGLDAVVKACGASEYSVFLRSSIVFDLNRIDLVCVYACGATSVN